MSVGLMVTSVDLEASHGALFEIFHLVTAVHMVGRGCRMLCPELQSQP